MIGWSYESGGTTTEVKCHQWYTLSTWPIAVEVKSVTWLSSLRSVSHCELTLPSPFPHLDSWEGSDRGQSPHFRTGDLCSTSLREEYLHKLFTTLLLRRFAFSPLILPVWTLIKLTDVYSAFRVIIHYHFVYFAAQVVPASATGGSFSWSLRPSDTPPTLYVFSFVFWVPPFFLTPRDAPDSCVFPAPVLEWDISPRNPGSFYWKMVLETKVWV